MLDIHVAAQHLKKERFNLGRVTIQRGPQVTKPFKCSLCGKIFDSEYKLTVHSFSHRSGSKATIEPISKVDKMTTVPIKPQISLRLRPLFQHMILILTIHL